MEENLIKEIQEAISKLKQEILSMEEETEQLSDRIIELQN